MVYTVTFNPAIDYIVHVPTLTLGMVNRTEKDTIYYGGKGINVSVILNNLGVKNTALGFIAGFTGHEIDIGLKAQGIPTDFITLKEGLTRINVKIRAEKETEINGVGPNITNESLEELMSKISRLNKNDVLVLAGSIPNSLPTNIYERILRIVSPNGVQTVVDATGDLLVNVLKYKPFLVKPNHYELGEIFKKELNTDNAIIECAYKIQEMGAVNVLVSMGKHGAMLLDENGKIHRTGVLQGEVKGTVGSGDSMVAGFIAGYMETHDYTYALKLGTAAGNATAFSDGLADGKTIRKLLKQIK
ncbi:MAG: 1-phosphofructokinase [Acutalibacteraceae bacterium]